MLQIKEIVNSIFTSKTYILSHKGDGKAWLVDIGDIEPTITYCEDNQLSVVGVFLTHTHFDHIYGLLSLLQRFPACKVYTNEYGKKALASEKLNMSKYHETPITYEGENVVVLHEGEVIRIFENEPLMQIFETPGHNPSCLTMIIGNLIFTGDAYIPGVKVFTGFPHANKQQATLSVERILKLASNHQIMPGHTVVPGEEG